jgi:hypothetical protein
MLKCLMKAATKTAINTMITAAVSDVRCSCFVMSLLFNRLYKVLWLGGSLGLVAS